MSRLVVTPLLLSPISRSVRYSFLAVIVLGTIIRQVGITTSLHGDELATMADKIFITEGKQPVEIIRTPEIEQGQFGRLRGIQSYRLVISKHTSKSNGDKL